MLYASAAPKAAVKTEDVATDAKLGADVEYNPKTPALRRLNVLQVKMKRFAKRWPACS